MAMNLTDRITAAWKALTKKHMSVHTSNDNAEYMLKDAIMVEALRLYQRDALSLPRFQMIHSVLFDRSVILQSMHKYDDKPVPSVIYECENEEEFNELNEMEIE